MLAMSKRKRTTIRTETIEGFSITYEREGGQTFAYGYCPICGQKEEAVQMQLDAGKIAASKIKTHIQMMHKDTKPDAPLK